MLWLPSEDVNISPEKMEACCAAAEMVILPSIWKRSPFKEHQQNTESFVAMAAGEGLVSLVVKWEQVPIWG